MSRAAVVRRASPLVRALHRSAQAAGVHATVQEERERAWATATFAGTLYRIGFAPDPCPAFAAWLATLPDADLDFRGGVVVDLTVEGPATIAALVVRMDAPDRR